MPSRRVAFFTGSRAEYGLLAPVIAEAARHPLLTPLLIVGGAHFDAEYGKTCQEIENDGRRIDWRVESGDSIHSANAIIAHTLLGVSDALAGLAPDFLVVYGDRSESFGALIAGTQAPVPTAHIEGGDYTEGGALDDSVRHAMTKLAHLHFTTNRGATERVAKMGEEPWRIHEVGLPALDALRSQDFMSAEELEREFALDRTRPVILFCQHSVATEADQAAAQVRPSLAVLRDLARQGAQIVATYPNSDAGGLAIIQELCALEDEPGIRVVRNLGRRRFHGMLHYIGHAGRGALVGNTSAGIKESAAFGCPTVNIGSRQQGRLRAGNVLDVGYDQGQIRAAIQTCLTDEGFRSACRLGVNPYGDGHAGERIAQILATVEIGPSFLQKKMTY